MDIMEKYFENTSQKIIAFIQEFAKESDRAAVILGAAKLDSLLYHLIQRFLLPSTGKHDELLDGDAALGTFSARIQIAYRLGIIDAELTRALNLIRRIRNQFAHEISDATLDRGAHHDRIQELISPLVKCQEFHHFRNRVTSQNVSQKGTSIDFRVALAMIVIALDSGKLVIDQLNVIAPISLTPPYSPEELLERLKQRESTLPVKEMIKNLERIVQKNSERNDE